MKSIIIDGQEYVPDKLPANIPIDHWGDRDLIKMNGHWHMLIPTQAAPHDEELATAEHLIMELARVFGNFKKENRQIHFDIERLHKVVVTNQHLLTHHSDISLDKSHYLS